LLSLKQAGLPSQFAYPRRLLDDFTRKSMKSQSLGMTKFEAVTFVRGRQIGWKEGNSRSLHCASLRSG
jgi:hypothetical protein